MESCSAFGVVGWVGNKKSARRKKEEKKEMATVG